MALTQRCILHSSHLPRLTIAMALTFGMIGTGDLAAGERVRVELLDGRSLVGEVDIRTNASALWLRVTSPNVSLSRSVDWRKISRVHFQSKSITPEEFQAVVSDLASDVPASFPQPVLPTLASSLLPAGPAHALIPLPPPLNPSHLIAEEITPPRHQRERVQYISIESSVANWDGDVENDGISLSITAVGINGKYVPVDGQVTVRLLGRQFDNYRGDKAFVELGRWNRQISDEEKTDEGAKLRLPFKSVHPDYALETLPWGELNVRLITKGSGPLEASTPIRLRDLDRLRDEWETQSGTRFFPGEKTGRQKPRGRK